VKYKKFNLFLIKNVKMKNQHLIIPALAFSVLLFSCHNASDSASNRSDTTMAQNDTTGKANTNAGNEIAMAKGPVDKAATDFAMDAARGGLFEVELGKIAKEKGNDTRTRDFGAMMVDDHSKINEQLKKVASSQDIALPDSLDPNEKKEMSSLEKKSGQDFDKTYMKLMESDHKKDLSAFQKASEKCTNPAIKEFALQSLPVLERHLDSAKSINKNE